MSMVVILKFDDTDAHLFSLVSHGNAIRKMRSFILINSTVDFMCYFWCFWYFWVAPYSLPLSLIIHPNMFVYFLKRHKIYCNSHIAADAFCRFRMDEKKCDFFIEIYEEWRNDIVIILLDIDKDFNKWCKIWIDSSCRTTISVYSTQKAKIVKVWFRAKNEKFVNRKMIFFWRETGHSKMYRICHLHISSVSNMVGYDIALSHGWVLCVCASVHLGVLCELR